MEIIRSGKFILILLSLPFLTKAQDTLNLSREQAEAVFLKENLILIAERLEIPKAEAMVLQAKLWPNPTIEISEVNLWATQSQIEHAGADGFLPPFYSNGDFGRNQQFGVQIEQLILTAGKRKKLLELEQVTADQSIQYFEDLLRNLKIELRNRLTNLQYLQFSRAVYQTQITSIGQLTQAYKKQVGQGNIPKGEYIRLKALELEIAQHINELNTEVNEVQKELKLLMGLPAPTQLKITEDGYLLDVQQFEEIVFGDLIDLARENRADFKIAELNVAYNTRLKAYEEAKRIPDIALGVNYDRGGNFIKDFVGFGLTMDLPFFNRNQGNIKAAKIGIEQSRIHVHHKDLSIENEVSLAYKNLYAAIQFLDQIEAGYEMELDSLLTSYTNNYISRNIRLLEYLDFLEAYLVNKEIILEAAKNALEKAEELNYTVGTDLIK
ncbi:TolC family protein [uncultured Cyclobacterium sp.]|uniref:TolC family protein n=1 Tax=uncultured Cyclobacterium sp. TaxID=453820 RepID=UPI0030EC0C78|tara:strand:+ start:19611 stop:20924 length:1314 start_codon:yes stop_codon:yes gene_type:complete